MASFSSLTITIILLALFSPLPITGRSTPAETSSNVEFIRTSCKKTTYPTLCVSSLSSYASAIKTSPTQLTSTALAVSLSSAKSTSADMDRMCSDHGMSPREKAAMKDCLENVRCSVDELRRSTAEMTQLGGQDLGFHISNIQTWVSAALTDENTCMDGFGGKAMDGRVKEEVRGKILKVAHLTSNALALVNGLVNST